MDLCRRASRRLAERAARREPGRAGAGRDGADHHQAVALRAVGLGPDAAGGDAVAASLAAAAERAGACRVLLLLRATAGLRMRPSRACRTLVAQLAQQSEAAYDDSHKSVKFGAYASGCTPADKGMRLFDVEHCVDLGHLLEAMSRHFCKVSVVVRGIDYMEAALALQLTAMADTPSSIIRTVFTSGDGGGQQDACMQTVSCPVEVMAASHEVRLYVRHEMNRRMNRGDASKGNNQPAKRD